MTLKVHSYPVDYLVRGTSTQGIDIHYITSIHYILEPVMVVVHYIFWKSFVMVVNTLAF